MAQEKNPHSFEIPSDGEANEVGVGSLLRLHFIVTETEISSAPRAERMWVEVCKIEEKCFYGHLTNEPVALNSLQLGDVIQFEWRHVAQIYVRKEDLRSHALHLHYDPKARR